MPVLEKQVWKKQIRTGRNSFHRRGYVGGLPLSPRLL